ncbi:MAG: hypothetical protein AB8B82_02815 [Roseovarius sp.]
MTGNLMFAFFIAMPAVVMFINRHKMRATWATRVMTYGGGMAVCLALVVIVPLLACSGSLVSGYTSCFGGAGIGALILQAQPLIITAAKIYILLGIPLALLTFALDRPRT